MGDFVLRCIVFTTNSAIHRRIIFILLFKKKKPFIWLDHRTKSKNNHKCFEMKNYREKSPKTD